MKKILTLAEIDETASTFDAVSSLVRNTQELFLDGFEHEGSTVKDFLINKVDVTFYPKRSSWTIIVEVEFE